MKILWLSHLIPYPPKGGVLQRSHYLLKETAKHHTVDILAFNQKDLITPLFNSLDEGVEEAQSVLSNFCNYVEFYDIPSDKSRFTKYFLALKSLVTKDPYNINWLKSETFRKSLSKIISENKYDLVHIDTISLIPFLDEIKHLPVVLDHHNIESHMLIRRAEKESNKLKAWYFQQEGKRLQRVEQAICPQMALNITCSEMDSQRLLKISPTSHVADVPNSVDEEYFTPTTLIAKDNKLLFIGTLSWYPNIEAVEFIANEIWPLLKEREVKASFDIVGANPPDFLLSLANVEPDFRVHGFVDDVRTYFNNAAIFVCPIKDGGGTKLKILDAMSMGKVVIAHPIACEGIKVEDGVSVIFAETAEEYVSQIEKVLSDSALREYIGINARQVIKDNYTNDSIGKKLSKLYKSCVDLKEK